MARVKRGNVARKRRKKILKLAVIDILPSHHIWNHTSKSWADSSWHWLFMMQPYDMPERLMAGVSPEYYIEKKISKPGKGLTPFSKEALAEYVRCFNWKTIRGSCEDYRACATSDLDMDTKYQFNSDANRYNRARMAYEKMKSQEKFNETAGKIFKFIKDNAFLDEGEKYNDNK